MGTSGFLNTMAGPLIQGYCLNYQPGACNTADEAFPRSDVNDAPSGARTTMAMKKTTTTTTPASVQFAQDSASVQFSRSSASHLMASVLMLALPIILRSYSAV